MKRKYILQPSALHFFSRVFSACEWQYVTLSTAFPICSGVYCRWIYASTLAYIVDANTGRSSSAVATNSLFRGLFGFVAAEVAAPLQNAIGDGGLYTLWAGLLIISELLVVLVLIKGRKWRESAIAKESLKQS